MENRTIYKYNLTGTDQTMFAVVKLFFRLGLARFHRKSKDKRNSTYYNESNRYRNQYRILSNKKSNWYSRKCIRLKTASGRVFAGGFLMKSKRKRYRSITQKTAGYYIMKQHTWLIGTLLLPCGQIPVTKWQSGQCS